MFLGIFNFMCTLNVVVVYYNWMSYLYYIYITYNLYNNKNNNLFWHLSIFDYLCEIK